MFTSSDFTFITLNTRGLKDNTKRKAVFLFCKGQKAQCKTEHFGRTNGGDNILLSHGSNESAGVTIFFNNCPGKIIDSNTDTDGHWIVAVLNVEGTFFILINVYGYNTEVKNRLLFCEITDKIRQFKSKYLITDNILVGGDFNVVPDEWLDRFPTRCVTFEPNQLLVDFCNNSALTLYFNSRDAGIIYKKQ